MKLKTLSLVGGLLVTSHSAFAIFEFDGGGDGVDFFDEANWVDTDTSMDPAPDTINSSDVSGFVGIANDLTIGGTFEVEGDGLNVRLTDGFTLTVEDDATVSALVFSAPGGETANVVLSDNAILTATQNIARTAFVASGDSDIVFTNTAGLTSGVNTLDLASDWTGTITLTQVTNQNLVGDLFDTVSIAGTAATEGDFIREDFTTTLGTVVGTIFRLVAGPPPPVEPPVETPVEGGTFVFDGGPDGTGVDFFDEANWTDTTTGMDPAADTINPNGGAFTGITSDITIGGSFAVAGATVSGNIRLSNSLTLTLEDDATLFSQVFSAPNDGTTSNIVLTDNTELTVTQNIARTAFDISGGADLIFSGTSPEFTTDTLNVDSGWTGTISITNAAATSRTLIGNNVSGLFNTVTIDGTPATEADFLRVEVTEGEPAVVTSTTFSLATGSSGIELRISEANGALNFEWNSTSSAQYDLRSATTLDSDPATWPPYNDGTTTFENIAANASGTNTLTGVNLVGGTRFFVITEQ